VTVDASAVDWTSARRASYRLRQSFRYEYAEPITELRHRLVIVPPQNFGDQRRLYHEIVVELEHARRDERVDRFGNVVVDVFADEVASSIEFAADVMVERRASEPNILRGGWPPEEWLLDPTPLTAADDRIEAAAGELAAGAEYGLPLADRINDWVYGSLTYRHDVTGVRTTAAEALAIGSGVCQDYAHVMLALTRACGLPSRYVSGHMVGQGGTHAWVEVVLPAEGGRDAIAWAFDPTHASRVGLGYVSIAVGRDYADVAPTSGTYRSGGRGRLTTSKQVTLTDIG
jgi:transglutaminase-like putative cysteine protease